MKVGDKQKISELLTRGVEQIYPSTDYLRSRLESGDVLTIYLGIDPTGPTLHLGHLIPLLKLRAFQQLGHRVILLIGDFTAAIGDPTDKAATRVALSREEVLENARLYKEQAGRIIKFDGGNPAFLKHNSEWLARLSFEETLSLASKMTFAQTIKRDMFQRRIKEGKDLYIHELFYPLMQGYDSVVMECDGEVGGSDQTFNMLVGRDLMKKMKDKEKFVIAMKLLADSSGKKIGKTEGNMVALNDSPEEMYGKIMSWADSLIIPGFLLCTDVSADEIDKIRNGVANGLKNPRDYKMTLAREVVGLYYGRELADKARECFVKIFQKKEDPTEIDSIHVPAGGGHTEILKKLTEKGLIKSMSEFRRLMNDGAVSVGGKKLTRLEDVGKNMGVLKIGNKRFIRLETEKSGS